MYPAVILAGGLGKRLHALTGGYPKYFFKIFGYPLIMYPINSLISNGVEKFIIVVTDKYQKHMEKTVKQYLYKDVEISYVNNPYPTGENGFSLLLAVENILDSHFLLSVADHIYSPKIVKILQNNYSRDMDVLVGADSGPKYINIDEATKILAGDDGRLLKIGKKLRRYTHVDIGLFLIRTSAVKKLSYLKENKMLRLSRLIHKIAEGDKNNVYITDVNSEVWTDVDTVFDIREIFYGRRKKVVTKILREIDVYVE